MRKKTAHRAVKTVLSKQLSKTIDALLRSAPKPTDRPERPQTVQALADSIGVDYQALAYWLSARNNVPAFILPALCKALENFEPMNMLERECGRMWFHVPHASEIETKDLMVIQRLVKEVGEALEAFAKTLADGVVEDHELPDTIKQLDDVIEECARLKHWLEKRCESDKRKIMKTPT